METLLNTAAAAALLHISPRTLERHRLEGVGLPYVKIGRCVRYSRATLEAEIAARTVVPERNAARGAA